MKKTYFARFHKNNKGQYEVSFPDLDPYAATFGDSLEEAITSAHDSLVGYLLTQEDFDEAVPAPSKDPSKFNISAPDLLVPVQVDLTVEREKEQNKLVKKTLTIPAFVNTLAKEADINFSATLTDALKTKLNIQ